MNLFIGIASRVQQYISTVIVGCNLDCLLNNNAKINDVNCFTVSHRTTYSMELERVLCAIVPSEQQPVVNRKTLLLQPSNYCKSWVHIHGCLNVASTCAVARIIVL